MTVQSKVPFHRKAQGRVGGFRQHTYTSQAKTPIAFLTMNSALDKLYAELLSEVDKEEPEEITDAEKAKRFLAEKQITIEKLREVRVASGDILLSRPCSVRQTVRVGFE